MDHSQTLRSTVLLLLFAVLAGSAAWACFGGIMANRQLLAEVAVRQERLEQRRATLDHLRSEIDAMRGDPLVQERWVRQELGYVRPGELLVLFPGDRTMEMPTDSPSFAPPTQPR